MTLEDGDEDRTVAGSPAISTRSARRWPTTSQTSLRSKSPPPNWRPHSAWLKSSLGMPVAVSRGELITEIQSRKTHKFEANP